MNLQSSQANAVFVDIEAAGLEIHRPIIQIAAIAVDGKLHEIEQFETKIHFDESTACPDALRKVHYRRAEWKRTAVRPRKAAWSFASFLRRHASVEIYRQDLSVFRVAQLVSHNSQFDGPFLKAWFERTGHLPARFLPSFLHPAASLLVFPGKPSTAAAGRLPARYALRSISACR